MPRKAVSDLTSGIENILIKCLNNNENPVPRITPGISRATTFKKIDKKMKYILYFLQIFLLGLSISKTTVLHANEAIDSSNPFANIPVQPVGTATKEEIIKARKNTSIDALKNREFLLSALVMFFGFLVLIFEYLLLRLYRDKMDSDEVLKTIGLTVVIIGTMFLISAGWSNDQIAPAVGLFGTIAGYLLGKSSQGNEKNEK